MPVDRGRESTAEKRSRFFLGIRPLEVADELAQTGFHRA
jgi:hypothetical protein